MLQFLCLQMCVYGGGVVPQGGVGDRNLVTIPQGGGVPAQTRVGALRSAFFAIFFLQLSFIFSVIAFCLSTLRACRCPLPLRTTESGTGV